MSRRPARAASAAVRRSAVLLLSACVFGVLSAGPALAAANDQLGPSERADLDSGLSNSEAMLYFVGGPAAVLIVVSLLVWLPGMARSERYRPGKGWSAAPLWFAGPAEPVAAVEAVTRSAGTWNLEAGAGRDAARGGASGDW